jgi:putative ABC transport system permease protein
MLSPRWLKLVRDLKDNMSRTILSVLSIAIGVIAFGGMLIARSAVLENLSYAYNASNPADITLNMPAFDRELVRWVKTQQGVADAQSLTVVNGTLVLPTGQEKDITLYALEDYNRIALNQVKAVSGAYPPPRNAFLIERGSTGSVAIPEGTFVGFRLNSDKVFNLAYRGQLYDVNAPSGPAATRLNAYVTERTLADLAINAMPTRMVIKSRSGLSVADRYALADRLVEGIENRGVPVLARTVNERSEHWAAATMAGIILVLVFVGAVALVMSGFLIVNVVNGLLLSQKKIIGIMKIIGADRWQIFGLYLTMMIVLGLLALAIAMPLSILLGNAIGGLLGGALNFTIVKSGFTWQIALYEAGVAMMVPLAFSALPIWSALRQTAAQAISEVAQRKEASLVERGLAALKDVPRTLVLAMRSLFRNNVRLVMTMLTLIAAGSIFTAIMNLRDGMPATMTRNTGTNTANVTLTFAKAFDRISIERRAAQLDGVLESEGMLSSQATVVRTDGDGSSMLLNSAVAGSQFINPPLLDSNSRWLDPYSSSTAHHIVLTQGILESEPNLKIGDTITLKNNLDTKSFKIIGFMRGPGAQGYVHYTTLGRFAGQVDKANSVRLRTAATDVISTGELAERARDLFESANITVNQSQSRAALINQVLSAFNIIIYLLIIVAALIAIVGGLGLAGTMSLSVMERTREIGVMRAVGAESPDLRLMFVIEGLCIGLLSAAIAFVLSWPLSTVVSQLLGSAMRQGSFDTQINWTGYGLWLVIVSVVSVVASISPARRATQISVREALAYA